MKQSLSSVDVYVLVKELLKYLHRARIDKIYQLGVSNFKFKLSVPLKGGAELVVTPSYLCLSNYSRSTPSTPTPLAMQLRKLLSGARIVNITQPGFERIVEIELEKGDVKYRLVLELFGGGNVILLDKNNKILALAKSRRWKHRILKVGETYNYPPPAPDPMSIKKEEFGSILLHSNKKLAASLAVEVGLTGDYAEEVCAKAGLSKECNASSLSPQEIEKLWNSLLEWRDMVKNAKTEAYHVLDGKGNAINVLPFELLVTSTLPKKIFSSFNEAVDEYFSTLEKSEEIKHVGSKVEEEGKRLRRRREEQKRTLEKMRAEEEYCRRAGDLLYQHKEEIEELFEVIRKARRKGMSDKEITARLEEGKGKGIKAAKLFRCLKREKIVVDI